MSADKLVPLKTLPPRWHVNSPDSESGERLARAIRNLAREKINAAVSSRQQKMYKKIADQQNLNTLAVLLLNRGIAEAEGALRFLVPDLSGLHSWKLLPDIEIAVARLEQARQQGEKVMIHGDYDADGITAAALLVTALKDWGLAVNYYLPHRVDDGYGLSLAGIKQGYEDGCTLLVTVDCGISNPEEVEYASSLGMEVIITDHHLPSDQLPKALAVVNPKRKDSNYPFSELAGVGLAWKLAGALMPESQVSSACLQLAALGTVADLVPLVDENRILVSLGLREINANPLPGVAALAAAAGCQLGKLGSAEIAFAIAPRLNAAGRMDSADSAIALLLERDPGMAAHLAQGLHMENQRRRQVEDEIYREALSQAREQSRDYRVLVLHGPNWHPGVVGIVASRILERFYRPTVVLCGQETLVGSARSVVGFDIHAALAAVSEYLEKFGGHPGAAGLSLKEKDLASFHTALDQYAFRAKVDQLLQPVIELETRLAPEDISLELVEEIGLLQPFGCGNPEPVFAVEGFRVGALDLVGRDKSHLRLRLDALGRGGNIWAIGFGKAPLTHNIDINAPLQAAGILHLNKWNGQTSVQLQFQDLKGPVRAKLGGRLVFDRRGQREPWLTLLASLPGTVFFANTLWSARRFLGTRLDSCRVVLLPPDKPREKVYNLEAENFCFLDPAWNSHQLQEIITLLPQECNLHFFGSLEAPADVLCPNLHLLRCFYKEWRDSSPAAKTKLLSLLPPDLAEPLLLERILALFAEAGLAGKVQGNWELVPVQANVDLTGTEAWVLFNSQLEDYSNWLRGFSAQNLDQLLA